MIVLTDHDARLIADLLSGDRSWQTLPPADQLRLVKLIERLRKGGR